MSYNQSRYLEYVADHPGCCVADVDRACRRNPQAGHQWVYDGIARLIKQQALRAEFKGSRKTLFVIPDAL